MCCNVLNMIIHLDFQEPGPLAQVIPVDRPGERLVFHFLFNRFGFYLGNFSGRADQGNGGYKTGQFIDGKQCFCAVGARGGGFVFTRLAVLAGSLCPLKFRGIRRPDKMAWGCGPRRQVRKRGEKPRHYGAN